VEKPGLYEVPFGVTFRHILEDLAGGIRDDKQFQAALIGGAAGAFISPDRLDIKLSFEEMRAVGLPIGAGAIMIFDETRDLRDILLRLGHFFVDESCGKCFPCQIGTQRQYEILQRIYDRKTLPGDAERLQEIAATMTDASLCGLGQTAAMAVSSAMKIWPGLFRA
jgi:NADH-quinone oxidoreductase subunit F